MDTSEALILLPPSEGKAPGGSGTWDPSAGRFGHLAPQRLEVVSALQRALDGDRDPVVLGAQGKLLASSRAQDLALPHAPVLPAAQRYCGVVSAHLDVPSLTSQARARASGVVFASALLGLVALEDPVPPYRLRVGASIGLGALPAWWRQHLVLDVPVVDMLTQEHAAMVHAPVRLAVRFVKGDRAASGHAAKAVKGLLARHLLTCGGDVREALDSFTHPQWHRALFDGDLVVLRSR